MADSFYRALCSIYPKERIFWKAAEVLPYESDGLTAFRAKPKGVVLPLSADAVVQTVTLCASEEVPFLARGSGTSLSGGAVPVTDGLLVIVRRSRSHHVEGGFARTHRGECDDLCVR